MPHVHARACPCVAAILAVAAALVLLAPAPSRAQSALDKLGRGVAGMTTGVLELPGNIMEETDHDGIASGLTIGLGKGIAMVIARELVGVYEFVTSPIPVPSGYRPILEPRYPWDYFAER